MMIKAVKWVTNLNKKYQKDTVGVTGGEAFFQMN